MDSFRPKQGHEDCLELAMIGKTLQVWADKEGKFVQEGTCCPQQTNGFDCGLFALASVAARARSRGETRHNLSDMKEQRIFLAWIVSLHNNHVE